MDVGFLLMDAGALTLTGPRPRVQEQEDAWPLGRQDRDGAEPQAVRDRRAFCFSTLLNATRAPSQRPPHSSLSSACAHIHAHTQACSRTHARTHGTHARKHALAYVARSLTHSLSPLCCWRACTHTTHRHPIKSRISTGAAQPLVCGGCHPGQQGQLRQGR